MILKLPQVLKPDEVAALRASLERSDLVDGAVSGKASLKNNLQSNRGNPGLEQATQAVARAMMTREDVLSYAAPRQVTLIFNCYSQGMFYKNHMDSALMGGMQRQPLRSDLSFTVFLSDPETYQGGALVMESEQGAIAIKEPAGDAVLYPSNMIHRVETVAGGVRWAAVGWIQSLFRDPAERAILFDIYKLRGEIGKIAPDSPLQEQADRIRENLIRRWADV